MPKDSLSERDRLRLAKLMRAEELTADEAEAALATILEGRATPAQIAGFAVALRMHGETVPVAGLMLFVSRWFFRFSLRRYRSASS